MTNWTPVMVGIVLTIVLGFLGILVPLLILIAPPIGGLLAAYLIGGDYKDGAVNGGITGGVGFLLLFGIFFAFFGAIASSINDFIGLGLAAAIGGAILGFIIGLILGIFGGVIGILLKGPSEGKYPYN